MAQVLERDCAPRGECGDDEAFAWLERAVDERAAWVVFLKVDPRFAPLRTNLRFTELLRRIGP